MTRSFFSSLVFMAFGVVPASAGTILDAMKPPADALRVEFSSPDTLKAGQPLTVGVVVIRSTGAVEIVPTSTPEGMTYDATTYKFSGVPVMGNHEIAVEVTDVNTGQRARGILDLRIETK